MTRPVVAFIGHPFHQKTRSSHFFVALLERDFDVHVFYIEPDPRALMQEIADAGYSLVVCWQTEFCAPYFLMRGIRVICVPMYDGVANTPDWYWLAMRQARFISFSQFLHKRLRSLGIESFSFQYYGDAKTEIPQASFEELRPFFWQRRPQEGLSYKFVRNLLGNSAASLHVHNAPDTERAEDWEPDGFCTVSHFSDTADGYRQALERCNVFICPRFSEGIGMAMLEALARGMCVIAHNEPTANEYVVDGVNGLLVDYEKYTGGKATKKLLLSPKLAERLGRRGREMYLAGCDQWTNAARRMPFLIQSAPAADLTAREKEFAEPYLAICRYAHRDFLHYLHLLLTLHRKGLVGKEASVVPLREHIFWRLRALPGAGLAGRLLHKVLALRRSRNG